MRIEFTSHIRIKMKERRIAESNVLVTIRHPNFTRPTYNGRQERYKKFGRNYLMVVVREESEALVAITVHWVRQLPA
ncbi:hypothetical protein HY417_03810 [Candidatus Kaiserbacteria bacterium]|nr:hypothetical protein [Candidatus Kaiserbacteria bacterium]